TTPSTPSTPKSTTPPSSPQTPTSTTSPPSTTTTATGSPTPTSTTSSTSSPTPTYTTTLPTPGTSLACAVFCSLLVVALKLHEHLKLCLSEGSRMGCILIPLIKHSYYVHSASLSTIPVSTTTTSGTTPTKTFTTTSGTTSSSFSTINATTTSTTFKTLPPGSTTTSGPTATSTAVTITGSDSWWLCECIKAICIEDNVVQVIPVICNPPPKPTCANGLSPVPVIDEDGCCWHWECDCYCTGWGDPHYMTFDGLYYSYQGNCTYVLVEEINKKVDNFGVYIDNYHCDTRDVVSCPRTLIVRHETQEVRLRTAQPNTLQVEVTVNNQLVALPYKKFGVSIYESGINRVVEIPELKMNVTYNGLSFSIRMPYSLFGNNTQGQCGTCNNNTADDCMLPNGKIADNCETMADHWQVVDPSKPQCSPGLVPTGSPSTTPVQPCKESSICELLLGSVFEPCHAFVQPEKYYTACVFDSCLLPNLDLECSSLQIYAATCADQGVCIDWRNHTNGVCSHECPPGKEYRACGPIKEMTCKSR
ncbi:MUC2L protein, partial [Dryoscopus gambensis]|nr:MUC2L protein [Dryoscopus gambensis]